MELTTWKVIPKPRESNRVVKSVGERINEVIRGNQPWPILLDGPAGCGKTCAALCVLDWGSGFYVTAADLCSFLIEAQQGRATWSSGYARTPHEIWKDWGGAECVVLDEIGSRDKVSDHHYETIKRAIDLRENMPAVYVSNLSMEDLAKVYDDRIASRLASGTRIEMTGDRRILKREAAKSGATRKEVEAL